MSNVGLWCASRRVRFLLHAVTLVSVITLGVAASGAAEPALPATPAAPGNVAAAPAPRTAADQALLAILDEGRAQVEALLAQALADPTRTDALQLEICRVKAETNLRFLQKQVELARASGDDARLAEAQQALDNVVNPPAPVAAAAQEVVK